MPVHVNIPIRIRLRENILADDNATWEHQLNTAIQSALNASFETVLSKRGAYVSPRFHLPTFHWHSGFSSTQNPEQTQRKIHRAISRAVSSTSATLPSISTLPTPLETPPSENLDKARLAEILQLYNIPSYDDEGTPIPVPVTSSQAPPADVDFTLSYRFRDFQNPNDGINAAINLVFNKHNGNPPSNLQVGALYKCRGINFIEIADVTFNGNRWRYNISLSISGFTFKNWQITQTDSGKRFQRAPLNLDPSASYRISFAGNVQNQDDARVILDNFLRPQLINMIQAQADRLGAISPETIQAQANEIAELEIERTVQNLSNTIRSILYFHEGGNTHLITTPQQVNPDLNCHLVVPTEEVVIPESGTQGSGGSGSADSDGAGSDSGNSNGSAGNTGAATPFPSTPQDASSIPCEPFLQEPHLDDLQGGDFLRGLIDEIAARLQITPCYYAAQFAIKAATQIGGRAAAIGAYANDEDHEAFIQQNPAPDLSSGVIEFRAIASPAIQFMRVLGSIVPRLTSLTNSILSIYGLEQNSHLFAPRYHGTMSLWQLRFLEAYTPAIRTSTGFMFVATCRIIMQQNLNSSQKNIQQHIDHLDTYAPIFEQLLSVHLFEIEALEELQQTLKRAMPDYYEGVYGDTLLEVVSGDWTGAYNALAQSLDPSASTNIDRNTQDSIAEGEIVGTDNNKKIRDRNGNLWGMSELNQAIAIRRGLASGIDPLVNQIIEDDDLLQRFRDNPNNIKSVLRELLFEMAAANLQTSQRNRSDPWFAFKASQINELNAENLSARTIARTHYALGGIHAQVHSLIGASFEGDPYYASGVSFVLTAELSRQDLSDFFMLTGVVLLSIACAPLAMAAGIVMSAHELDKANIRRQTFRSLLNPEGVASRAEVEAQEFAAYLGAALTIMPYVGRATGRITAPVLRGPASRISSQIGSRLAKVAPEKTRLALQTISRVGAARSALRSSIAQIEQSFFLNFAMKMTEEQIEDLVIDHLLINPVILEIMSRSGPVRQTATARKAAKKAARKNARPAPEEENQLPTSVAPTRVIPLPPPLAETVSQEMEPRPETRSIQLRRIDPRPTEPREEEE